jgi:flavin reductase (DIM6/NTAB) family NADH-FMN oxidoreductase RutF
MSFLSLDPKVLKVAQVHGYLLGAVAPRPIALVSTVDADGNPNLSPFSFFNVFSANPPIAIFSPARRGRDNTTKHTYENAKIHKECVINIVNFDMVQQMSLSSTEYPKGVNEFIKSGFTPIDSEVVKPPRVMESPVQLECIIKEVIELGSEGGAGNLIVSEVVRIHINENVLDDNGKIDPVKIVQVARLGGDWYSRAKDSLFSVAKPLEKMGIGVDQIPSDIRYSFSGDSENMQDMISSMNQALLLSIIFIYLILTSLYESFVVPFTILIALPLAFCGAFYALFITGESVNIFTMLGIFMLVSVSGKNSILLIDYANRLIAEGKSRTEALIISGRMRLRPILMTSIALIAGTIPVAI